MYLPYISPVSPLYLPCIPRATQLQAGWLGFGLVTLSLTLTLTLTLTLSLTLTLAQAWWRLVLGEKVRR